MKNIMDNIMILVNNVNFGQNPKTGDRKFVLDVLNFFGNLFA